MDVESVFRNEYKKWRKFLLDNLWALKTLIFLIMYIDLIKLFTALSKLLEFGMKDYVNFFWKKISQ